MKRSVIRQGEVVLVKPEPWRFILIISLLLVASHSYAFSPNWLLPMIDTNTRLWGMNELNQAQWLYDCGEEEENREFCSEESRYYKVVVDGRLWLKDKKVREVRLTAPFTPVNYSELILGLRKDGFQLAQVTIGQERFDVRKQLKEGSENEVDSALIRFLNKGKLSSSRTLTWYPNDIFYAEKPNRMAQMNSSSAGIEIRFFRDN